MMHPLLDERRVVFATIFEAKQTRFLVDRESVRRRGLGGRGGGRRRGGRRAAGDRNDCQKSAHRTLMIPL